MTATLTRPAPAPVATGGITYTGKRNAAGPVVFLEEFGRPLRRLRHVVKHSPAGPNWGYAGSGPADLARSLIIDALAGGASCPTCAGTCRIVWAVAADQPRPFDPAKHNGLPSIAEDSDFDDEPDAWVDACPDCDDGYRADLPYQHFKSDVVARFPRDGGWTLPRRSVLDWLAEHGVEVPV